MYRVKNDKSVVKSAKRFSFTLLIFAKIKNAMIMTSKYSKNGLNLLSSCNEKVTEAITLFKNENCEEAILKLKTALELAKLSEDISSQIVVCQILGTCQRLSNDHDAAWTTFVKGWNLIETFNEEFIISDLSFMFYAYEMLRVESNVKEKRKYYERFNSLWGLKWETEVFQLTNI